MRVLNNPKWEAPLKPKFAFIWRPSKEDTDWDRIDDLKEMYNEYEVVTMFTKKPNMWYKVELSD